MDTEETGSGLDGYDYKKVADYELSEDDIRKLMGNVKVITYPDLAKETLDTLFPQDGTVVILFLTEAPNVGHWTSLTKKGGLLEYFDSYGIKPDGELAWLDDEKAVELGQTRPLIWDLLKRNPGEERVQYNSRKLQKGGVSTCGRHVVVRGWNVDLPVSVYGQRLVGEGDPDQIVCEETFKKLGK